jgi:hypothetical protein
MTQAPLEVVTAVNVAVTDLAWVRLTVQVLAVPEQAPDQPPKVELLEAVAVSVTLVPVVMLAVQVPAEQVEEPTGATVPEPLPEMFTDKVCVVITWVKLAVTLLFASAVSVQVAVPEQSPPQPANW